jgi:molybdopterin converting factor small subunit
MKILIPTPLRQYADKKDAVELTATTVGEALKQLTSAHPELKKHLFTESGQLRAFVNVYLNDEDVRYLAKDQTPVSPTDTLAIIPSIAGGSNKLVNDER